MTEFLIAEWPSLLVVALIIVLLCCLYKMGYKAKANKIVLSLVVQAEKAFGSGTGELKYAYVVEKFYDKLPTIIKLLFTKKEIDTLIETAVQQMKKALSGGATLTGYDDERYLTVIKQ